MSLAGVKPAEENQRRKPDAKGFARPDIRVLIVDDSLIVRTIFKRMLESDARFAVVGSVGTAERALAELARIPADVVLLDLEMPGMGGLEALPKIQQIARDVQVLVISSLTRDGAQHTIDALEAGAADTMLKPRAGEFTEDYRQSLTSKVAALGQHTQISNEDRGVSFPSAAKPPTKKTQALLIGASTGGIHALGQFLRAIPSQYTLPILITQHLPEAFMSVFARQVEQIAQRETNLAHEYTEILEGQIVIATGEGHMTLDRRGSQLFTRVTQEIAPSGCMPSVDPMISSATRVMNGRVAAVFLSGMGRDGLIGARELADAGGSIYAQDAASSAVWGMPGAVAKAGLARAILPPAELAVQIMQDIGVDTWK